MSLIEAPPAQDIDLRDYQLASVEGLRNGLRAGHKRLVLCAPTGAGKTHIAAHLIQEAHAKGSRAAFVCDLVTLVRQTSQRFTEFGIPHGVAQGQNTYGRSEPIQVCSAQTLEKRGWFPSLDLLVVDECHVQRKVITEFAVQWGGPVIGLSATPFTRGLGEVYSDVVNVTTTDQLIADGWIAPLKVYAATEIDMTGAATNPGGEWQDAEVERRGSRVVGDIVSEWVDKTHKHFGGPVKTIGFSATVAHGEEICRAFQSAGYDFRQISYRDRDDAHRADLVERFRRGDIMGLVSCEALAKGFDVPDVMCLIGARPYRKSLAAHIQQIGRVMRASPGKPFGLVLDFSGNFHGFYHETLEFFAEGCNRLDDGKRQDVTRKEGAERAEVKCTCGMVQQPAWDSCPGCGRERKRRAQIETVPGRMEEVDLTAKGSRKWAEDKRWTWKQMASVALEWCNDDAKRARKLALAKYKTLYDEWPPYRWGFDPSAAGDDRVRRKMRQLRKDYEAGRELPATTPVEAVRTPEPKAAPPIVSVPTRPAPAKTPLWQQPTMVA